MLAYTHPRYKEILYNGVHVQHTLGTQVARCRTHGIMKRNQYRQGVRGTDLAADYTQQM